MVGITRSKVIFVVGGSRGSHSFKQIASSHHLPKMVGLSQPGPEDAVSRSFTFQLPVAWQPWIRVGEYDDAAAHRYILCIYGGFLKWGWP